MRGEGNLRGSFLFTCVILASGQVRAQSYFVWGGGPTAESSQVVLERNLNLFHEIADAKNMPPAKRQTYFGAGNANAELDVVYRERPASADEKLLATMYGPARDAGLAFRHNQVSRLTGDATKENLMTNLGAFLISLGDAEAGRLFFTGHGHGDPRYDYQENIFFTYGESTVNVQEFANELDMTQSNAPLQVVMTQCFSGGFAQINYADGKFRGPYSKQNRCGFFSQIPSRPAAGCSPDILDREEYSPYFFAALSGKTEAGASVNADFNGDSKVSAREAHYYVVVNENSFDVPVTTSSEFLETEIPATADAQEISDADLETSLRPEEKAAYTALMNSLGLSSQAGSAESRAAQGLVDQRAKLAAAGASVRSNGEAFGRTRSLLIGTLMALPHDTTVEELVAAMKTEGSYASASAKYITYLEGQKSQHAELVKIAKFERLQYLIRGKKLERALAANGSDEQKAKYRQLVACESDPFF